MAFTRDGVQYASQYQYRKALAARAGYANRGAYERDKHASEFFRKLDRSPRTRHAYEKALEAVNVARNSNRSLSKVAKELGTSTATIKKYAPGAVEARKGKLVVRSRDAMPRRMAVPTAQGVETVILRDSRQASLIGKYGHALRTYLTTGDTKELQALAGATITVRGQKVKLLTNPAALDALTRAGELDGYAPYPELAA